MHATSVGKAGLPQNDLTKQKIAERVEELSKGSKFWQKKQEKLQQQTKDNSYKKAQLLSKLNDVDCRLKLQSAIELANDMKNTAATEISDQICCLRYIVHIDMDSFFASVEMKNLNWDKNKPLAVGGDSMLSTANYAARKFGVRSAMPGFIARKLCPELTIVPSNFTSYREASDIAKSIFDQYSETVIMGSLDEAYLDVTGHVIFREMYEERKICKQCFEVVSCNVVDFDECPIDDCPWNRGLLDENENPKFSDACEYCGSTEYCDKTFRNTLEDTIEEIRYRVELKTGGLTCSAGVSVNTFIAKCLSDKAKPDGYKILIEEDEILEFLKNLPVGRAPGIGPVTEKMLKDVYGIEKFNDIREKIDFGDGNEYSGAELLCFNENISNAKYFVDLSYGVSGTLDIKGLEAGERKGLGHETTFSEIIQLKDIEKVESTLKEICESVSERLCKEAIYALTVCIKMTTDRFDKFTRQKKTELQFVQKPVTIFIFLFLEFVFEMFGLHFILSL